MPGTCSRSHRRVHMQKIIVPASEFDSRQQREPEQKTSYFFSRAKSQSLLWTTSAKCAGLQPSLPARSSRTLIWFGHGCAGNRRLSNRERYYGLGMDALVTGGSRIATGNRRLSKHEHYNGLGMDALVSVVCSRNISKHKRYYGLGMDVLVTACSSFIRSCPLLSAVLPPLQPSWLASPAPWPTPRGLSESTNLRTPCKSCFQAQRSAGANP